MGVQFFQGLSTVPHELLEYLPGNAPETSPKHAVTDQVLAGGVAIRSSRSQVRVSTHYWRGARSTMSAGVRVVHGSSARSE